MNHSSSHSLSKANAKAVKAAKAPPTKKEIAADGASLANRLNLPESWVNPEERHLIEDLLLRLAEMIRDCSAKPPRPNLKWPAKGIVQRERRQREQMRPINDILRRYTWFVELVAIERKEGAWFVDFPADLGSEALTARTIIRLARANLLDRLRKCAYGNCNKWFYATKPKKIYCSSKCQQAYNRSTPKFKERSRKYHKKYYRDVLSPVTAKQTWRRKLGGAKGREK